MPSPPPTPSTSAPKGRSQWRFRHLMIPTEWVEDYRPGKFHPIDLGDLLHDGRYKILRKLGYGAFSTVWLARDEHTKTYAAMKVLTAQTTPTDSESQILHTIAQSDLEHPGKANVLSLRDSFQIKGPNGEHGCLVFDPMGPSTASMVEHLPKSLVAKGSKRDRYPLWMAKSILKQALLGIDFLHKNGIVHGDLQPGNLLFSVKDLDSVGELQLSQKEQEPKSFVPVERLDGKIDLWAPKYLVENRSLTEFVDLSPSFRIKISDMGGAFFIDNPPKSVVTPVGLRSPEIIVGEIPTPSQDIWSFGCLVFEFLTGLPLFAVDNTGDENDTNDDHFLQLFDTLGKVPKEILAKWERTPIYFNEAGDSIKHYIGELTDDFDPDEIERQLPLGAIFEKEKPEEMSDDEAKEVKRILGWILQYDVTARPSASELLKDPWFLTIQSS